MLDLWFGLDASGFDRSSALNQLVKLHQFLMTPRPIPSNFWTYPDGDLRVLQ